MNWNACVKHLEYAVSTYTFPKPNDGKNMQIPKCGIGFPSNWKDLYPSINRVFDDIFSCHFSTWLCEWAVDKTLDDQMFAAFPAAVPDEVEEGFWVKIDLIRSWMLKIAKHRIPSKI